MISPTRSLLTLTLVAAAVVLSVARPAAAATPCWKALLNDWYDGRIDHTYAIHCYSDALKHLPADVRQYSSAHDDIERALQSAIAEKTKKGERVTPNTLVAPPSPALTTTTSPTTTGGKPSKNHKPGKSGKSGSETTGPTSGNGVGRSPGKGLIKVVNRLSPGSADSLPVPLLVLGGLALLLVAAGAAGLVAKRLRTRRPGA